MIKDGYPLESLRTMGEKLGVINGLKIGVTLEVKRFCEKCGVKIWGESLGESGGKPQIVTLNYWCTIYKVLKIRPRVENTHNYFVFIPINYCIYIFS